ncbi:MAG: pyrroline-5-carboxylate reductase family protein, partial [Gaiellaceae bacterium]
MTDRRVAFLGGGKMGEALIAGLIRSGARSPEEIIVTCRREEHARDLAERHGVAATLSNPEAADAASTLVLCVKPQDMEALLRQFADAATPDHLVISIAAGIRTSFIEAHLADDVPVVRVMSNVPVL